MSEETIDKILSVDIKFKTNQGRKKKIHLTDFLTDFLNENTVLLIDCDPDYQYKDKVDGRKYKVQITIDCDAYSYKVL